MHNLQDIEPKRRPSRRDCLIHVYRDRCVINASAAKLLHLHPSNPANRVHISRDMEELRAGRTRVYISEACADMMAYPVGWTKGRLAGRITGSSPARTLAKMLDGYGTYRICEEISITQSGRRYFEIFFMKFGGTANPTV